MLKAQNKIKQNKTKLNKERKNKQEILNRNKKTNKQTAEIYQAYKNFDGLWLINNDNVNMLLNTFSLYH